MTTLAAILYPSTNVVETLYLSLGDLPLAPETNTAFFPISLIVT